MKLECKIKNNEKLSTKARTNLLKAGDAITPEHTCRNQITQSRKIIAKRAAIQEQLRKKQLLPSTDRDNTTALFVQEMDREQTQRQIEVLKLDKTIDEDNNTVMHSSYGSTTTLQVTIVGILALIL